MEFTLGSFNLLHHGRLWQRVAIALAAFCALLSYANAQEAERDDATHPGRAIYDEYCSACHNQPAQGTRAPPFQSLRQMSAQMLTFTLTEGVMKPMAAAVPVQDMHLLVSYLAAPTQTQETWIAAMRCSAKRRDVDLSAPATVTAFGVDLRSHRHLTSQQAGLSNADFSKLELKWAMAFPQVTALRGQPVVVGSTLFISVGQTSRVYALDAASGCVKWVYVSETPLRTSLSYGELGVGGRKALVVGDDARVHALDAKTGERIWVKDVKVFDRSRLSAAPLIYRNRVIVALSNGEAGRATNDQFECCRTHGAVVALDAATGDKLWSAHTMEGATLQGVNAVGVQRWGPSGAPIWAHPTIDAKRDLVYVATGENFSLPWTTSSDAILAIELATGKIKWSFQGTPRDAWNSSCGTERSGANCPPEEQSIREDWDFGGSVVLAQRRDGTDILLAGQKSGHVWALDPDSGKLVWSQRFGFGTTLGGVHFGLAVDGERVFAPINDSVRPNRFAKDPVPGLNALDIDSGKLLWSYLATPDCTGKRRERAPQCDKVYGLSSPPLVVDQAVVTSSVDGRLRIFDAPTGKILFTYDTLREFKTINGVPGQGGQIDNGAYVAANGTLFVLSGYGQIPGNVLLAFRPGK